MILMSLFYKFANCESIKILYGTRIFQKRDVHQGLANHAARSPLWSRSQLIHILIALVLSSLSVESDFHRLFIFMPSTTYRPEGMYGTCGMHQLICENSKTR